MSDEQARKLFNEVILGHWPNWPSGSEEVYIWVTKLRCFDYSLARDAINELYAGWNSERYPKMAGILAAVRKYAISRHRREGVVKHYTIMRADGRRRWFPFWGKAGLPKQDIEEAAAETLAAAKLSEPDNYILWPEQEQEPVPF